MQTSSQRSNKGDKTSTKPATMKDGISRMTTQARSTVSSIAKAPVKQVRAISATVSTPETQRVVVYGFFCFACVHLLFVILSCPLSQLDISGGACYTYWGYKEDCDTVSYTNRTQMISNCGALRSSLEAGAAFSIFSILLSAGTALVAWIVCCRLRRVDRMRRLGEEYNHFEMVVGELPMPPPSLQHSQGQQMQQSSSRGDAARSVLFVAGKAKLVGIILMSISLLTELICWAIVAGIQARHLCSDAELWKTTVAYGVGFGLSVTAWLCEIIALVVFIIFV